MYIRRRARPSRAVHASAQRDAATKTSIAAVLSEIVAVRVCGKNGGIGIPKASLVPGASASATESVTWLKMASTESTSLARIGMSAPTPN